MWFLLATIALLILIWLVMKSYWNYNKVKYLLKLGATTMPENGTGMIEIEKNGSTKYGYLHNFKFTLQPVYDLMIPDGDNMIVAQNGKYGVVCIDGRVWLNLRFDMISKLADGYKVCWSGKCGVYQPVFGFVVKIIYDDIVDFGNGFFEVRQGELLGIVGNNIVIPPLYDKIELNKEKTEFTLYWQTQFTIYKI